MTVPHQSEAPVRGRTGFSKIGDLLASVPSVSCPNFRAASLRKIVFEALFDEKERLLRRLLSRLCSSSRSLVLSDIVGSFYCF